MRIRFFVSSGEQFELTAPDGSDAECKRLPREADRFAFWRRKTGDSRIRGHVMVWSPVDSLATGHPAN
jgi:hypothetical protein